MYIGVLNDMYDRLLSEQEKDKELENVTNGRKAAFGDNFKGSKFNCS